MQFNDYINFDKKYASINKIKYSIKGKIVHDKAIFRCINILTDDSVVIKFEPFHRKKFVEREVKALSILIDTENVITLLDSSLKVSFHYNGKTYYGCVLILNYCNNKDLHYLIEPISRLPLDEKEFTVRSIFRKIVITLNKIHEKFGINHRDLKPENIFINNEDIIIGDWAFSTNIETLQKDWIGTPAFASPQILHKEKYSASKNDIWSLGVILFELLFGVNLYDVKKTENNFIINYYSPGYYANYWCQIPTQLKDLIISMIEEEESKRPSLKDIMANEWFNKVPTNEHLLKHSIFLSMNKKNLKQNRQNLDMSPFRPTSP